MTQALQQRCRNHLTREAAVRCPLCRDYFCRECVTEHDDRLICAVCLKKLQGPVSAERRNVWAWLAPLGGLLVAWAFFSAVGWALSNLL